MMKKIICFVIAMMMLSAQAFAATYYDVNVEGLTSSEKKEVTEWLEDEGYEYDVESYTSNSSNNNTKELEVKNLTSSEKNILVNWLKNKGYKYAMKTSGTRYYITVKYTNNTKSTLINYLNNRNYNYNNYNNSNSSDRTGKAYLVADGYLWYADGDDIDMVDSIYSNESILFTKNGSIAYINSSRYGKLIEDIDNPKDTEKIATSVKSITTNSTGYATSFKSSNKTTKLELDDDLDNEKVTVYVVKNNALYSLSPKNKLTKLKSLKSVSNTYSKNTSNIGFSEWGDLVFIDASGVCFYNEEIDDTDEIETLKDQNGYTVQAKYLTVKNGVVQTLTLTSGTAVRLKDD